MTEENVKKVKRLSKRLKEEPVEIECEDGRVVVWKVKELMGPQRSKYLQSRLDNFHHDKQGNVTGIKSYIGMIESLLKDTVYDEEDKLVSLAEINKLPTTTQQELFVMAAELSGFTGGKKEAGEESSPTTPSVGGGSD